MFQTPSLRPRLLLAALAVLAGACEEPATCPVIAADAGQADATDAAPPLRRLARRDLFGDMPVHNRFFDPRFALVDGVAWGGVSAWDGQLTAVATRMYQPTPGGQPAIRVTPPEGMSFLSFGGMVKSTNVPIEVSIWVGRVGVPVEDPQVALVGLYRADLLAVDLVPDGAPPVTLEGVAWQRFRASLAEGPVAWANLEVTSITTDAIYLTSPVLVPSGNLALKRAVGPRRPLTPAERDLYDGLARRVRERLGTPAAR
jgi:hypothetical protein